MEEAKEKTGDALSYHYEETVRLANICDSYARGAFADFKLLAGIGGILTWKPIHDALGLGNHDNTNLLFMGFIVILLILAIIGIMNLQKQLIINFYLEQLQYFESEIRSLLGRQDSPTFRVAENWRTRMSGKQRKLGMIFYFLFYAAVLTPLFILTFDPPQYYGVKYLVIAAAVIIVHIAAVYIVHSKSQSKAIPKKK
jgi:hypothetical protein